MKNVVSVVALLAGTGGAQAGVSLAYWAFPDPVPPSADNFKITWPLNADAKLLSGPAHITTNAAVWDGSANPPNSMGHGSFQYFSGSSVNLQAPFTVGSRLSFRANTNLDSNGKSMTFRFDSTGYKDIFFDFAERTTSSGPTNVALDLSSDGVNFTSFGGFATTGDSTFRLRTIDFSSSSILNNKAAAYVRFTMSGYSSASGNIGFDNILVSGAFIPAPGAAAFALAGIAFAVRRRRV